MAKIILLLGKTGHGKSATGNTLLGMESFDITVSPNSTTKWTERCSTIYNGINLSVIDTPGIFETNLNETDDQKEDIVYQCQIVGNLMNSLGRFGVNAFFFVYNISVKYTDEEEHAFNILIQIFGTKAIVQCGVLVFTHKDTFGTRNFEEWLSMQTGRLADLINMFDGKVLFISNISDQRKQSRREMMAFIERNQRSYTITDYENQKNARELLILKETLEKIKTKYQTKINHLNNCIQKRSSLKAEEANDYLGKINRLQRKIKERSLGTNKLDVEFQQLDQLKIIVNSKNGSCALL